MDAAQRASFRLVPVEHGVFRPAATDRFFVVDVRGRRPVPKLCACVQRGLHFTPAVGFAGGCTSATTCWLLGAGDARSGTLARNTSHPRGSGGAGVDKSTMRTAFRFGYPEGQGGNSPSAVAVRTWDQASDCGGGSLTSVGREPTPRTASGGQNAPGRWALNWRPTRVLPVLWWIITPRPSLRTMLSGPRRWDTTVVPRRVPSTKQVPERTLLG